MVNQYCAHSFAGNWQLPFSNQQKGENDRRKYFMISCHERMLLTQQGSNSQPPDHQSDAHPTEPLRLVCRQQWFLYCVCKQQGVPVLCMQTTKVPVCKQQRFLYCVCKQWTFIALVPVLCMQTRMVPVYTNNGHFFIVRQSTFVPVLCTLCKLPVHLFLYCVCKQYWLYCIFASRKDSCNVYANDEQFFIL